MATSSKRPFLFRERLLAKEEKLLNKPVILDEAQKIPNIGQGLKILVDQIPGIKIIATGSSSFELAGQVGEPLTGRKTTLTLYPVSHLELAQLYNPHEIKEKLGEWLVFGAYPEVVTTEGKSEKARLLEELVHSYLLKDLLELEKVKSSKIVLDLLRLLAFQVGNEVSLSELGQQLGIDYKTVARYLDLFEKSFVIISVRGFSRNLRKEVTKKCKYYFYDNGIRNAVISNFNGLELRNDLGSLWENFLFFDSISDSGGNRDVFCVFGQLFARLRPRWRGDILLDYPEYSGHSCPVFQRTEHFRQEGKKSRLLRVTLGEKK